MDNTKQAQDAAAQCALVKGILKIRQASIYAVQTSMEKDQKFSSGGKGATAGAAAYWSCMEDIIEDMKISEKSNATKPEAETGPFTAAAYQEQHELNHQIEKMLQKEIKESAKRIRVGSIKLPPPTPTHQFQQGANRRPSYPPPRLPMYRGDGGRRGRGWQPASRGRGPSRGRFS